MIGTLPAYMLEGIKLMELANSAYKLFPYMNIDEKREMISLVLSNPTIQDATLRYSYKQPFKMFVDIEEIEKWRECKDTIPSQNIGKLLFYNLFVNTNKI